MENDLDWNDLKFFLSVAKAGTLSAASSELGVSISTVSRRIGAMETALQVKLFRSRQGGYDLTPAGQELVVPAERAQAQMRLFQRTACEKDDQEAGTVRIVAPELLGNDILLPAISALQHTFPDIRVELHSSVTSVRLTGEYADIVIRLVRPEQGNYLQRKIGKIRFGLYASENYFRHNGKPHHLLDLYHHRIIGWTDDLQNLLMARWLVSSCPGLQPALELSSFAAHLAASRLGMGIALIPDFAAAEYHLARVLGEEVEMSAELWILTQIESASSPRIQIVRDELIRALARFN